jgi:hypothetical protein
MLEQDLMKCVSYSAAVAGAGCRPAGLIAVVDPASFLQPLCWSVFSAVQVDSVLVFGVSKAVQLLVLTWVQLLWVLHR